VRSQYPAATSKELISDSEGADLGGDAYPAAPRAPPIDGAPVSRGWCCDRGRDVDQPWPDNHIHRVGMKFPAQRLEIPCFTFWGNRSEGSEKRLESGRLGRPEGPEGEKFPCILPADQRIHPRDGFALDCALRQLVRVSAVGSPGARVRSGTSRRVAGFWGGRPGGSRPETLGRADDGRHSPRSSLCAIQAVRLRPRFALPGAAHLEASAISTFLAVAWACSSACLLVVDPRPHWQKKKA
jgi:hypothetical protein